MTKHVAWILARILIRTKVAAFRTSMTDRQLVRKLVFVVLIKLVLLMGLWWAFIRGQQVVVNSEVMAQTVQTDKTSATGESRHGH